MLGFTETLGIKRIGRMFPYRPLLVSFLRITWLRRVPLVWPLLSFQPWLLPWTDPSRRIGVYARSGHSVITWTKQRSPFRQGIRFVSFRKSFQKDIVPATVSSWIKQTIVLCYQLSDQQAQQLHQVRAHDVRGVQSFSGWCSLRPDFGSLSLEVS